MTFTFPTRIENAFIGQRLRVGRGVRIGFLAIGLMIPAVALSQSPAKAPAFPTKPLRIVVPFGSGGIADLTARTVAEHLAATLKQPVIIDNKPGAGGVVAAESVAKGESDGHTLLLMSNANAVSAGLFKKLPIDAVRDFTPVGMIGTFDLIIVAGAKSGFTSLPEMLAYAKANPDKLNIGTINIGSTQHLSAELFKTMAGIRAQVVPFNGTPAIISALRGGQIDVAFEILGPMYTQIQSGALKGLAVTGDKRDPSLPDVPTVKESGVSGYSVSSWNALAVPSKTPATVVTQLNRDLNAALATPAVVKRLRDLHVEPKPGTSEAASQLLQSEIQRWGAVIAKAGIPRE